MAHWAELDENNIVLRVTVGDNNDPNGDEGYQWLIDNVGGRWVKTSYNHNFRKQYAGIGFRYDEEADVFIKPSPFPSWVLNSNYDWEAPIPKPNDNELFIWDEQTISWLSIPKPFESWVLTEDKMAWKPPVDYPMDGKIYRWDEPTTSWIER